MHGTLAPLIHRYLTSRVRMGELVDVTVVGYRTTLAVLDTVHGRRPLEQVGRRTVERWKESREGLMPSTVATQWSQVSGFLDWLVRNGKIQANPCRDMVTPQRPRTEPRIITAGGIVPLLHAAPDARARAILMLEWGMGARRIEVHRANVEHWSRRGHEMLLIGKHGHERTVSVPTDAAHAFDAYLTEHPATVGPFFRSYTRPGTRLTTSTLGHYVARWMLDAGVKLTSGDGLSGHALRRTCASELLDETGDIRIVQEVLGHAHLSSSAPYLKRLTRTKMLDAMETRRLGGTGQLRLAM